MKRVLIYKGKSDDILWDASTPELTDKAYRSLFRLLDEEECYYDLKENYSPRKVLSIDYKSAKEENIVAIRRILEMRRHYEYEWWNFFPVQEVN